MEPVTFGGLPGGDLVEQGVEDLDRGRESIPGLLVAIGASRLRAAGVAVPTIQVRDPELRLYELLATDDPDTAHGRYNALLRRLTSFERAAEHASTR